MIDAAARLDDLLAPPANRLEKLHGNLEGYYSIRIRDEWRVIYRLKNLLSPAPQKFAIFAIFANFAHSTQYNRGPRVPCANH